MNEQTKLGIHSEGILFTLKREEILSHVITWMNFEDIMLSKPVIKRQILYDTMQIPNTCRYHLHEVSKCQIQRKKVEWWLPGFRGRERGQLLNGCRVSNLQDEKVLESGSQQYKYT